jgi:HNH endonuclease
MQCCHANGIRNDNRLDNIRWGTAKENNAEKLLHGTAQRGERNGSARTTNIQAEEIVRLLKIGQKHRIIAIRVGVKKHIVDQISSGKTWRWLTTSSLK